MNNDYIYVNSQLERINISNTKVYKMYLEMLPINSLRKIFNYYYSASFFIDYNSVLDTKTFYINKILEHFDYNNELF